MQEKSGGRKAESEKGSKGNKEKVTKTKGRKKKEKIVGNSIREKALDVLDKFYSGVQFECPKGMTMQDVLKNAVSVLKIDKEVGLDNVDDGIPNNPEGILEELSNIIVTAKKEAFFEDDTGTPGSIPKLEAKGAGKCEHGEVEKKESTVDKVPEVHEKTPDNNG